MPADKKAAEEALGWQLRAILKKKLTGNVAVVCLFFRSSRQPVDTDNLLKFVLDGATGICWDDDRQVTAVAGVLELDTKRPRTVIALGEYESSMARGTDAWRRCKHCGIPFDNKSQPGVRFCSRECRVAGRKVAPGVDNTVPVHCAQCGAEFRKSWSGTKFCSEACRAEALRGRNRARRRPDNYCDDCGRGPLANKGAKRCRDCWRIANRTASSGMTTPSWSG
jgi:hypothetical protein